MNLRQQAAADLKDIVEDDDGGFGWSVRVYSPAGISLSLVGLSNDISQAIDPETGVAVSGRTVTVALRISAFTEANMGMPVAVHDASPPWIVEFDDINGESYRFKVTSAEPDRSIGLVVCHLEFYQL